MTLGPEVFLLHNTALGEGRRFCCDAALGVGGQVPCTTLGHWGRRFFFRTTQHLGPEVLLWHGIWGRRSSAVHDTGTLGPEVFLAHNTTLGAGGFVVARHLGRAGGFGATRHLGQEVKCRARH
ncbi:hypothetical protein AMTR_s00053p00091280 [Amborella trichopoda]|uniref:Uncharacterized protein n=1 Tax=Amborella trichopoda TaxID=13333 RepID=W1PBR7_AMBTC|nr:hypothetical protein AMTR_s00053p00091280 [Amborella trichopoda]